MSLSDHDWRTALRSFLRWWLGELSSLIPAAWQQRWRIGAAVTIHPAADHVRIDLIEGEDGRTFREDMAIEDLTAENWEEIRSFLTDRRASVELPSSEAHILRLDLPVAAMRDAHSAVAVQLLHRAPVAPEKLYWALSRVEHHATAARATVVLARRSRLDDLAAQFEAQDIASPPIVVRLDGEEAILRGGLAVNLSPQRRSARRTRAAAALLILSIPITLFGVAELLLWSGEREVATLRKDNAPKVKALALATQTDLLQRALAPLAQRPVISAALADLAGALPPGTTLATLSIDDSRMEVALASEIKPDEVAAIARKARAFVLVPSSPGEQGGKGAIAFQATLK